VERAIHKQGYVQTLWDIVEKLANADDANSREYLKVLYDQPGVIFNDYPTSSDLELTTNGTSQWIVKAGKAIDPNRDLIVVAVDQVNDTMPPGSGSRTHLVVVEYQQSYEGGEDVPFDKTHSVDGHTYAHNNFVITALASGVKPSVNQMHVGDLVYTEGATPEWIAVDRRYRNIAKISKRIEDEQPPVPTRLRLTTGFDEEFKNSKQTIAGNPSERNAWIKAEIGDWGTGTASGNTFTYSTNQLGAWTNDEWIGQYLIDQNGDKWEVLDNNGTTLTFDTDATPATGNFWLGPGANGYEWLLQTIGQPPTEEIKGEGTYSQRYMASPVKQWYIWHGLTPDVKYSIRSAAQNDWFSVLWSVWCSAQTIIAGGAKAIPDTCEDALQNFTKVAKDGGIEIGWDVKPAYTDDVAGVEIVFTDDGSDPDFDTLSHQKIYTTRKKVVLPTNYSTRTEDTTVKFKMRVVDKAARHCITPRSDNKVAKKSPSDLNDIVDDYTNILAEGSFSTLKDLLSFSIDLPTGRGRAITETEGEVQQARGGYATVGDRISGLSADMISWENVRIVAESGAPYNSIVAALQTFVAGDDYKIIWVQPGIYTEDIEALDFPAGVDKVCIIGNGRVKIIGRIIDGAPEQLSLLSHLHIETGAADVLYHVGKSGYQFDYRPLFVEKCVIKATGSNRAVNTKGRMVIRDSYLYGMYHDWEVISVAQAGSIVGQLRMENSLVMTSEGATPPSVVGINVGHGTNDYIACWLFNNVFATSSYSVSDGSGTGAGKIIMAGNKYSVAPSVSTAQLIFGTLENQSNVKFDAADLADIFGNWESD